MEDCKDFNLALEKHLKKEELLFRAKNKPGGSNVDWLAPSCEGLDDIVDMLRWLGFKVKEIVNEDVVKYVTTTSGVIVFTNTEWSRGFVSGRGY